MATTLPCGIKISTKGNGNLVVAAMDSSGGSKVEPALREVTTVEGGSESVVGDYIQKVWEADSEAESRALQEMFRNPCADTTTFYKNIVMYLLKQAEIPEPMRHPLLHIVNTVKGWSNTDGFWDDEETK